MQGLQGKVYLVFGASSGIGRATVLELARAGAHVIASARREDALAETVRMADDLATSVTAAVADVTDESSLERLMAQIVARQGRLDGAVNAAGASFAFGATHTLSRADFTAWIDNYLTGTFLACKHELRLLRESGGGSIVNVGTFVGLTKCMPGAVGYAAAKTGLIGLTRTIAREYAGENIRANLLIVGGTETPLKRAWMATPEQEQAAAAMHALQRFADPAEIGRAARFLLSGEASFITGAQLAVEGGLSLV